MRPALTMGRSSSLSSSLAGFLGCELMSGPFPMSRDSPFARNLPFCGVIHCGKPAPFFFCHDKYLSSYC